MAWEALTDEQRATRELVRTLAREHVGPRAAEVDRSGEFPWDLVELLRSHDLFALPFQAEHGGVDGSALAFLIAIEELAKACATTALTLALQETGSLAIKLAGTDEQKRHWLPALASGERLCAYALSEPGAGSDVAALQTRADRDRGGYVLNGSKRFISNAGVAGVYTVFAKTHPGGGNRGISAFVVESGTPGLSVGRIEPKMGLRGQPTGEIFLGDCRVSAENRLGEEGDGFRIAMRVLDRTRPGIAAQALGLAEGATEHALAYAGTRRTFGRPIAEHQLVAGMLADMATRCAAAGALVYSVGRMIDAGADGPELTAAASMAKLFTSDVAMTVTTDAVQVLGGYGYVQDYPLERMFRDAKATQIYEGTNEIQRLVIARMLAARGHSRQLIS